MKYTIYDIIPLMTLSMGRRTIARALFLRSKILLMPMAKLYRKFVLNKTCVIAVIGSFGKTTTTRAIKAVLLNQMPSHHNRNPESYVAVDILRTKMSARYAVFEAGIDRPGRMAKFAQMIQPDIVVVTSIGKEHHTSFNTLENTRHEKAEMVRGLLPSKIAVFNADDPNVMWMKTKTRAQVITFGFSEEADIRCVSVNYKNPQRTHLCIDINDKTFELDTRLIGKVMVYPILAAITVAWVKGINLSEITSFLETLPPTNGRLQPVVMKNGMTVLLDDYKAPEETYKAALEAFEAIPAKRRIAVIGEVEEIYGKEGPTYRWLGNQVAQIAEKIIFFGGKKRLKPFRAGVNNSGLSEIPLVYAANNIRQSVEILKEFLQPDDLVLLKGNGDSKLQRIIPMLEGETVRCELKACSIRFTACRNCPMLERGWNKNRTAF